MAATKLTHHLPVRRITDSMVHRRDKRSSILLPYENPLVHAPTARRSMRTPAAIPMFLFCAMALAAATRAQAATGEDAAGRELKAAQAKCAGKTGVAADRCLADAQTRGGKT